MLSKLYLLAEEDQTLLLRHRMSAILNLFNRVQSG